MRAAVATLLISSLFTSGIRAENLGAHAAAAGGPAAVAALGIVDQAAVEAKVRALNVKWCTRPALVAQIPQLGQMPLPARSKLIEGTDRWVSALQRLEADGTLPIGKTLRGIRRGAERTGFSGPDADGVVTVPIDASEKRMREFFWTVLDKQKNLDSLRAKASELARELKLKHGFSISYEQYPLPDAVGLLERLTDVLNEKAFANLYLPSLLAKGLAVDIQVGSSFLMGQYERAQSWNNPTMIPLNATKEQLRDFFKTAPPSPTALKQDLQGSLASNDLGPHSREILTKAMHEAAEDEPKAAARREERQLQARIEKHLNHPVTYNQIGSLAEMRKLTATIESIPQDRLPKGSLGRLSLGYGLRANMGADQILAELRKTKEGVIAHLTDESPEAKELQQQQCELRDSFGVSVFMGFGGRDVPLADVQKAMRTLISLRNKGYRPKSNINQLDLYESTANPPHAHYADAILQNGVIVKGSASESDLMQFFEKR